MISNDNTCHSFHPASSDSYPIEPVIDEETGEIVEPDYSPISHRNRSKIKRNLPDDKFIIPEY